MTRAWTSSLSHKAFSLVELLLVIAVIAIMATLVISAFSNAAEDTRNVIVRQQQVAVQQAVNAWVSKNSSGEGNSLSSARTTYNGKTTARGKFDLAKPYLDEATYNDFTDTSGGSGVQSSAMAKTGHYLELPAWASNSYPKVNLK